MMPPAACKVHGARALAPVPAHEAPERPEMLGVKGPRGLPPAREWVIVAKDELAELHGLEKMLRGEKTLLAHQAALTLNRTELSACEALPVAKMAVEDVCNREMKAARRAVEDLSRQRYEKAKTRERRAVGYEMGRRPPAPPLTAELDKGDKAAAVLAQTEAASTGMFAGVDKVT